MSRAKKELNRAKKKLISFRKTIHELIPYYRDASIDLIDALSTNKYATGVTQLSENPFFRRKYNSITKVINYFLAPNKSDDDLRPDKKIQKDIQKNIVNLCSVPEKRDFFYSQVTSLQP